jgi:hypothetical protein
LGVVLVLASDRVAFDRDVRTTLGYSLHRSPSRPSLVAVSARGCTVLLSPRAYLTDSSYRFDPASFDLLLAHEAAHLYHFRANPRYRDAPPLLVEGLAVFLSGQFRRLDEFRRPVLAARALGQWPVPADLLDDPRAAYLWGWTVVGTLDAAGGPALLRALLAAPDPLPDLKRRLTDPSFPARWKAWLERELEPVPPADHRPRAALGDPESCHGREPPAASSKAVWECLR